MRRDKALIIAEALVEQLRPTCTRIEIAGSIRRGMGEVKDIEIVAIPKMDAPRPKFGMPIYKTQVDEILFSLRREGFLALAKNGDKYKKFFYGGTDLGGINVDLFLVTPPAQWGVVMAIRTGPREFSQWMVTRRAKGGTLPNNYIVQDCVVGKRVLAMGGGDFTRDGELPMPEEIDFLSFLGLGWIEPSRRAARWRK